jgi:hypothetical protein
VDLTFPVVIGSATLNDVAYSGALYGTTVDAIDLSEVDVRQFEEPLAKANGIETGGVWLGARHISISGTLYGTDHDDLMDRAASLIEDLSPATGGFGLVTMSWYEDIDTSGAIDVRPDGPRFQWDRVKHGGANMPSAVQWTLKCIAPAPTIYYAAATPLALLRQTAWLSIVNDNVIAPWEGPYISYSPQPAVAVAWDRTWPGDNPSYVESNNCTFGEFMVPRGTKHVKLSGQISFSGDPNLNWRLVAGDWPLHMHPDDFDPGVDGWPDGTVIASGTTSATATLTDVDVPLAADGTRFCLYLTVDRPGTPAYHLNQHYHGGANAWNGGHNWFDIVCSR